MVTIKFAPHFNDDRVVTLFLDEENGVENSNELKQKIDENKNIEQPVGCKSTFLKEFQGNK